MNEEPEDNGLLMPEEISVEEMEWARWAFSRE